MLNSKSNARGSNARGSNAHRWLWAVLLLAIVLRLGAGFYLGDSLLDRQQARVWDQVSYHALANSLLDGKGYTFEKFWYPFTPPHTPTAHWSFLYPLYLAGVYALFGVFPLAARLIQALISATLATWLFYRLGKRLFGEQVGVLAAGLGAVYAYFIFYDAALMTESFYILGVLGMLDLALVIAGDSRAKQPGQARREIFTWILLGVVMGITTLIRQAILLWLPFLLAWIIWVRRGKTGFRWWQPAIALGILAVFILPWTIRNYRAYGAFLPLNSNAGYALYSANHPDHGVHFDQDYAAPLPPELRSQGLNEAEWNTALTRRGLAFMIEDPQRYLLLSLNRVSIFFNFWLLPESSISGNLMRLLSFGLYLPFFVFGLLRSRSSWRKCSLIYLFVLVYSLMHILTWSSVRYRLPVDAALMPFAALAVVEIAERIKTTFTSRAPPAREISNEY